MTRVQVHVMPKESVLDPQGATVARSLRTLGHEVADVRVGRVIELTFDDNVGAGDARARAERMCEQLLANPVIETWRVADVTEPVA